MYNVSEHLKMRYFGIFDTVSVSHCLTFMWRCVASLSLGLCLVFSLLFPLLAKWGQSQGDTHWSTWQSYTTHMGLNNFDFLSWSAFKCNSEHCNGFGIDDVYWVRKSYLVRKSFLVRKSCLVREKNYPVRKSYLLRKKVI